jgi:hypothetical protein
VHYTFVGLSAGLAALLAALGAAKVLRAGWTVRAAEHLSYSVPAFRAIGAAELAAAAGLLAGIAWFPLGTAAAAGLVALLIGAVLAHRRAQDPAPAWLPPAWLALASAGTAVLGVVQ